MNYNSALAVWKLLAFACTLETSAILLCIMLISGVASVLLDANRRLRP